MNMRIPVVLVASIGAMAVFLGSESGAEIEFRSVPATATPLVACQSIPTNLTEDVRLWYIAFCSATNADERIKAFVHGPQFQPSQIVSLLPLLSELMATDDYSAADFRRFYVAQHAAENMAESGADAVPFIIKALQSKKAVEVHAGLWCASKILTIAEMRGKTNDLPTICSKLLPYVTVLITNAPPESQAVGWIHGFIPNAAKQTEERLRCKRRLKSAAGGGPIVQHPMRV